MGKGGSANGHRGPKQAWRGPKLTSHQPPTPAPAQAAKAAFPLKSTRPLLTLCRALPCPLAGPLFDPNWGTLYALLGDPLGLIGRALKIKNIYKKLCKKSSSILFTWTYKLHCTKLKSTGNKSPGFYSKQIKGKHLLAILSSICKHCQKTAFCINFSFKLLCTNSQELISNLEE